MPQTKTKAIKYENALQLGGIRTGTLDDPEAGGGDGDRGCRVALFDTGSGLRFTVALGRGGDIVDAKYNDTNLAYLTPNGLAPTSHGVPRGDDWLRAWAGGLVTTCGPETIGTARIEDGKEVPLHGRYSNSPAAIIGIKNPSPQRGINEMSLSMLIRDSRMFGPVFEVRRTISCTLGVPEIHLHDEVTNLGDTPVSHNWLYHVNLGYPLLDEGAKLIYQGNAAAFPFTNKAMSSAKINRFKRIPASRDRHTGAGEDCVFIDPPADRKGLVHVGLVNTKRRIGLELIYPKKQLPRLVNWQRFAPSGSYVTAIEPFYGSLLGKDNDPSQSARTTLRPGQRRSYGLTIRVLDGRAGIDSLKKYDGPLMPIPSL
jgi:Domain of unknown function (DUF4432)